MSTSPPQAPSREELMALSTAMNDSIIEMGRKLTTVTADYAKLAHQQISLRSAIMLLLDVEDRAAMMKAPEVAT